MNPRADSAPRFIVMDALRGLGALLIYLVHVREFSSLPLGIPAIVQGWGIEIFYFLSGFFVYRALFPRAGWDAGVFLWRRWRRLLPAYYVSILLIVGLIQSNFLLSPQALWVVGQHLLMIHTFNPDIRTALNTVYWMLGNIFWFSMGVALFAPLFRGRYFTWVAAAGIVLCWAWRAVVFTTLDMNGRLFWGTLLPGVLELYLLGMLAARLHTTLSTERAHPLRRWLPALALAGVVLLGVAQAGRVMADSNALAYSGWRTLMGLGMGGVVLALLALEGRRWLAPLLRATGLPALGSISYSFFLYHLPVLSAFNYYILSGTIENPWLLFAIMTGAALLISAGSYYLVERRALQLDIVPLFQWRRSYPHEYARQD